MMVIKRLLLLITLFHSIALSGQSYFNETSLWKQSLYYSTSGSYLVEEAVIRLDGDTLIGSTLYHKVLKTGMATSISVPYGDTLLQVSIHEYMDPIREEPQFIYSYKRSTGQEYLLYDFSAEIGDTLQSGNCALDTVIDIDTVYLGDRPMRRFHLPQVWSEISTLVEGIGSTLGFYWDVCNSSIPALLQRLQCYSKDGYFIQFDPNFDCSSLILADQRIEEKTFSISPNPFRDEFQIHFLSTFSQTTSISIVNLMGAIIFEKVIQSPEPVEQIAVPFLPAGIYFVLMRSKGRYTAEKIVKI